jgi:hypothetical protein
MAHCHTQLATDFTDAARSLLVHLYIIWALISALGAQAEKVGRQPSLPSTLVLKSHHTTPGLTNLPLDPKMQHHCYLGPNQPRTKVINTSNPRHWSMGSNSTSHFQARSVCSLGKRPLPVRYIEWTKRLCRALIGHPDGPSGWDASPHSPDGSDRYGYPR